MFSICLKNRFFSLFAFLIIDFRITTVTLAIEETPLKHIGCYRHLNGDLKAWSILTKASANESNAMQGNYQYSHT